MITGVGTAATNASHPSILSPVTCDLRLPPGLRDEDEPQPAIVDASYAAEWILQRYAATGLRRPLTQSDMTALLDASGVGSPHDPDAAASPEAWAGFRCVSHMLAPNEEICANPPLILRLTGGWRPICLCNPCIFGNIAHISLIKHFLCRNCSKIPLMTHHTPTRRLRVSCVLQRLVHPHTEAAGGSPRALGAEPAPHAVRLCDGPLSSRVRAGRTAAGHFRCQARPVRGDGVRYASSLRILLIAPMKSPHLCRSAFVRAKFALMAQHNITRAYACDLLAALRFSKHAGCARRRAHWRYLWSGSMRKTEGQL